jgi:hypothetical protein
VGRFYARARKVFIVVVMLEPLLESKDKQS